jgi:hypothetical protein
LKGEIQTDWVDQGERYPTRCVLDRSLRPTRQCFSSVLLCQTWIMRAKGQAPKVDVACASREPVQDIPEERLEARKG